MRLAVAAREKFSLLDAQGARSWATCLPAPLQLTKMRPQMKGRCIKRGPQVLRYSSGEWMTLEKEAA